MPGSRRSQWSIPRLVDVFNCIAASLLGLMLIFGNAIEIRRHGLTVSSILGLLPPIAITLIPLWIHLYLHYRFKSSRVSDGPCLIDFGEDNIVTEMPGFSKSTVEWAAIKKYREAGKILMLYVSRTSFIVIPKRAIGPEEFPMLLSLLQRKLSPKS